MFNNKITNNEKNFHEVTVYYNTTTSSGSPNFQQFFQQFLTFGIG